MAHQPKMPSLSNAGADGDAGKQQNQSIAANNSNNGHNTVDLGDKAADDGASILDSMSQKKAPWDAEQPHLQNIADLKKHFANEESAIAEQLYSIEESRIEVRNHIRFFQAQMFGLASRQSEMELKLKELMRNVAEKIDAEEEEIMTIFKQEVL